MITTIISMLTTSIIGLTIGILLGLTIRLAIDPITRAAYKKACRRRVITVLAALLDAATRLRNWASAAVYSRCDLCWRSRRPVPLPSAGAAFTVAWAPGQQELRATAWIYRVGARTGGPSAEDWRECARAFGLVGAPDHVLVAPATGGPLICAVSIDLASERYKLTHTVAGATRSWERPIVLGSLSAVELLSMEQH